MKITNHEKSRIAAHIEHEKERYGSFNKMAKSVGISNATISNMLKGNWDSISDSIWHQVAGELHYSPADGWRIAETHNIRQINQVIYTARKTRSFWAISNRAGSGKTAAINMYSQINTVGVYSIQAKEWTQRQFLLALTKKLGIEPSPGYNSIALMLDKVCDFFTQRSGEDPILLIDEADKLKDAAKRVLIPLYNHLEDKLACVIAGTENLKKELKNGVKNAKKGFDEIDSRFGRTYIDLMGATKADVRCICELNGVDDQSVIERIFNQCEPVSRVVSNQSARVVEDLRRVKRLVIAHKSLAS